MKKFMMTSLAAAAAMALTPGATAQDTDMVVVLTSQQQAMYDDWSAEQRATYDAWPADVQTYYWTLAPMQTEAWWQLNDEQRVAIFRMAPAQRAATWQSISQQLNQRGATTRTSAATSGNIQYRSNAVVQATPYDQGPPTGNVPICSMNDYDNCINAWEAGKRGPGVTKPLDYWPGPKNDPRAGE